MARRNSANASSRILTRVLREASVLLVTGREQHAGCARKKLRRRRWRSRRGRRSQSLRTSSGTVSGGPRRPGSAAFSGSGCSGLIARPSAISEKSPVLPSLEGGSGDLPWIWSCKKEWGRLHQRSILPQTTGLNATIATPPCNGPRAQQPKHACVASDR